MVGTMLDYGWRNIGLWLMQRWLIIVGETLAYNWFCVVLWLAQRWLMFGRLLGDGLGWHNVG